MAASQLSGESQSLAQIGRRKAPEVKYGRSGSSQDRRRSTIGARSNATGPIQYQPGMNLQDVLQHNRRFGDGSGRSQPPATNGEMNLQKRRLSQYGRRGIRDAARTAISPQAPMPTIGVQQPQHGQAPVGQTMEQRAAGGYGIPQLMGSPVPGDPAYLSTGQSELDRLKKPSLRRAEAAAARPRGSRLSQLLAGLGSGVATAASEAAGAIMGPISELRDSRVNERSNLLGGLVEGPTDSGLGPTGLRLRGANRDDAIQNLEPRGYQSAAARDAYLTGAQGRNSLMGDVPGYEGQYAAATAMPESAQAQMAQMEGRRNSATPMGPNAGFMPRPAQFGATDFSSPGMEPDQANAGRGRRIVVGRDGKPEDEPIGVQTPEQHEATRQRIYDDAQANRGKYQMGGTGGIQGQPPLPRQGESTVTWAPGSPSPRLTGPATLEHWTQEERDGNRVASLEAQEARTRFSRGRRDAVSQFRQGRLDEAAQERGDTEEAGRRHEIQRLLASHGTNPNPQPETEKDENILTDEAFRQQYLLRHGAEGLDESIFNKPGDNNQQSPTGPSKFKNDMITTELNSDGEEPDNTFAGIKENQGRNVQKLGDLIQGGSITPQEGLARAAKEDEATEGATDHVGALQKLLSTMQHNAIREAERKQQMASQQKSLLRNVREGSSAPIWMQ